MAETVTTLTAAELIGNFEEMYSQDREIKSLQSQKSELGKLKTERVKDLAKDLATSSKYVNAAYQRYKTLREKKEEVSDDEFYKVLTMVDEYFLEEEEKEDNK